MSLLWLGFQGNYVLVQGSEHLMPCVNRIEKYGQVCHSYVCDQFVVRFGGFFNIILCCLSYGSVQTDISVHFSTWNLF